MAQKREMDSQKVKRGTDAPNAFNKREADCVFAEHFWERRQKIINARLPITIGLTGGLGSGKSSVAAFFRDHVKVECIDADQVCRELLEPHAAGWYALRETFGTKYFNEHQAVDRCLLRKSLFNDENFRLLINKFLHPLALEIITERLSRLKDKLTLSLIIVEVPLLFEAHWDIFFDRRIVVYSTPEICLKRVLTRDKISQSEAEAAIAAQWLLRDKAVLADHVINNSGCWAETCLQLMHLIRLLRREEKKLDSKK